MARAKRCICTAEYCDGYCPLQDLPTALYRLSNDYWGITSNVESRLADHRKKHGWDLEIVEITWYTNRSDALKAEREKHRLQREKH